MIRACVLDAYSSKVRVRESLKELSTCSFVKLAMSMNLSGLNKRQAQNYRTKSYKRYVAVAIATYQWYGLIISIPEAAILMGKWQTS